MKAALRLWAPAGLVALVALLWMVHRLHGPTLGADDHGQYLLHARALVEGRPYTDIGFIHTRYSTLVAPLAEPPGLPVVIAGVFRVAGQNVEVVRLVLVASFVLFGLAAFGYVRRFATPLVAFFVAAWTLVAIGRLHVLDTVLSDVPFCAAMWCVFLLADRGVVRGTGGVVLLALAGAAAFAFRMAALPLLPAAATALLLRRREERPAFFSLGLVWTLAAVALMWWIPAGAVLGGETVRSLDVLGRDVALNAREMLHGARDWVPVTLVNPILNRLVHGVVLLVAVVGAFALLRDGRTRFLWISAAWYILMLVVLPTRAPRYLWPLYPLMTWCFVAGLVRLSRGARRTVVAPAHHALFASASLCIVGFAQDALRPTPPSLTRIPDVTTMRLALARERPPGSPPLRVVVFAPRALSWEDGHITMAPFDAQPDEMLRVLRDAAISHVVVGDPGSGAAGIDGIARLVRERPEAFVEVFSNQTLTVVALRSRGG